jgi:hypothetical protein
MALNPSFVYPRWYIRVFFHLNYQDIAILNLVVCTNYTGGQDCQARLLGNKTAGQDCQARLSGKTAGQDCRIRSFLSSDLKSN